MNRKASEIVLIVEALVSAVFANLPTDLGSKEVFNLFKDDKIDADQLQKWQEWRESRVESRPKSFDLFVKRGEKGYLSISGGQLGVARNRPVVGKASTILALLTQHRVELIEELGDFLEGYEDVSNYRVETRTTQEGRDYTTVLLNDCVVGSGTAEKVHGVINHMFAQVS